MGLELDILGYVFIVVVLGIVLGVFVKLLVTALEALSNNND
jgi:hypothetical protein